MKYSLRAKLSLSYMLITIMCVALISMLANFFLEKQFKEYVIQNLERKSTAIIMSVNEQYQENEEWKLDVIESIGVNAIEQGLIIKVKDARGYTIWDAREHNQGRCEQIIAQIAQNMSKQYPNLKGAFTQSYYQIINNSREVGSVEIGYYGPFFYTDNDMLFINTLNKLISYVALVSLIIAFAFGSFMSRRISTPISRAINTAQMISKGNYNDRSIEKSDINEINLLTSSINDLAISLESQEKLRKRMTEDVAHELRNPVATLQSHMEAMIDGIWEPTTQRLRSCYEEIMRIGRMIGDIEKLARYESESLVLNKVSFDISQLIQGILLNFETQYNKKSIEVSFSGDKEVINADKDKISQVLVNLISNALKYTAIDGKVEIKASGNESAVQLIIKDNGIGIADVDLPHIFERFYRADKSRSRLTGGSGIGLTIAKAIIDAHNGNISVKSELNKGTVFTVLIPRH